MVTHWVLCMFTVNWCNVCRLTSHCSVFWFHCTSTSLVLSVPLNSVGASVWLRSTEGNWRSIPKLIRLNHLRVCWRPFSSSEQALFHWMVIPTVEMQVTWLILPVVICLSQRLSHACLSISLNTVKLRTAHYISYSLFDGFFLQG